MQSTLKQKYNKIKPYTIIYHLFFLCVKQILQYYYYHHNNITATVSNRPIPAIEYLYII